MATKRRSEASTSKTGSFIKMKLPGQSGLNRNTKEGMKKNSNEDELKKKLKSAKNLNA